MVVDAGRAGDRVPESGDPVDSSGLLCVLQASELTSAALSPSVERPNEYESSCDRLGCREENGVTG